MSTVDVGPTLTHPITTTSAPISVFRPKSEDGTANSDSADGSARGSKLTAMGISGSEMCSPLRGGAPSLFTGSPLRSPYGALASPIPLFQPSPLRSKRPRSDEQDDEIHLQSNIPGPNSVHSGDRRDDAIVSPQGGSIHALPDPLQALAVHIELDSDGVTFGQLSPV